MRCENTRPSLVPTGGRSATSYKPGLSTFTRNPPLASTAPPGCVPCDVLCAALWRTTVQPTAGSPFTETRPTSVASNDARRSSSKRVTFPSSITQSVSYFTSGPPRDDDVELVLASSSALTRRTDQPPGASWSKRNE